MDIGRLVTIRQPVVHARYELQEVGQPDLAQVITEFLKGPSMLPLIRGRYPAPS